MKRKKEKGIALVSLIIVIIAVIIIIGVVIGVLIISKNNTKNNVFNDDKNINISSNRNQDVSEDNEDENINTNEKVELENQKMYATGNENWKKLMKPSNEEMYLYTDKDEKPYITILPIFEHCHCMPENIRLRDELPNIKSNYQNYYESEKDDEYFNTIYIYADITKKPIQSVESELAFWAEYNRDDDYIDGTRVHSDIKEKTINNLKVKYVQIQAKDDLYINNESQEIYINRYDCSIEFIEPYTKKMASIDFKIKQDTNNVKNFMDDSIIDEVVKRLSFKGVKTN